MFKTIPLSLKAANDFVTNHHRHNKKTAGHKFSIGATKDGELIGGAMGGEKIITYTLESEPGSSLKAIQWTIEGQTRKRSPQSRWNTRQSGHKGYVENRTPQIADSLIKNRWERLL